MGIVYSTLLKTNILVQYYAIIILQSNSNFKYVQQERNIANRRKEHRVRQKIKGSNDVRKYIINFIDEKLFGKFKQFRLFSYKQSVTH